MSRKTPQKTYTAGFRKEAVKMIQKQRLSYRAAADKLGVPEGTLVSWVNYCSSVILKVRIPVQTGHAFHGKLDSKIKM